MFVQRRELRERREKDRECPRVRLRPWVTSAGASSWAAASVSNLTGNFFLIASKPQSLFPQHPCLCLRLVTPPLLLSSPSSLSYGKPRDLRVNTYEQPHPEPLNYCCIAYLLLKVAKYNEVKACLPPCFSIFLVMMCSTEKMYASGADTDYQNKCSG